jgi:hypothetical protein
MLWRQPNRERTYEEIVLERPREQNNVANMKKGLLRKIERKEWNVKSITKEWKRWKKEAKHSNNQQNKKKEIS